MAGSIENEHNLHNTHQPFEKGREGNRSFPPSPESSWLIGYLSCKVPNLPLATPSSHETLVQKYNTLMSTIVPAQQQIEPNNQNWALSIKNENQFICNNLENLWQFLSARIDRYSSIFTTKNQKRTLSLTVTDAQESLFLEDLLAIAGVDSTTPVYTKNRERVRALQVSSSLNLKYISEHVVSVVPQKKAVLQEFKNMHFDSERRIPTPERLIQEWRALQIISREENVAITPLTIQKWKREGKTKVSAFAYMHTFGDGDFIKASQLLCEANPYTLLAWQMKEVDEFRNTVLRDSKNREQLASMSDLRAELSIILDPGFVDFTQHVPETQRRVNATVRAMRRLKEAQVTKRRQIRPRTVAKQLVENITRRGEKQESALHALDAALNVLSTHILNIPDLAKRARNYAEDKGVALPHENQRIEAIIRYHHDIIQKLATYGKGHLTNEERDRAYRAIGTFLHIIFNDTEVSIRNIISATRKKMHSN